MITELYLGGWLLFAKVEKAPHLTVNMWLGQIVISVLTVLARPFRSPSEEAHVEPLSGYAKEVAHNAFYSTQEMLVHPDHAGIKDTRFRWYGFPGRGTVPFVVDEDLADIRQTIDDAMEQYHKDTCIRFVPRTDQENYIHLKKSEGCWSYVGKQQKAGPQIVSIGEGCAPIGTVVHELGHAIGLFHEHQRSDRNSYIKVFEKNIREGFEGQFNRTNPRDQAIYSRYDTSSIMHYGNYAFSKQPGELKTMEAKSGVPLLEPYQKPGLNAVDIQQIKSLYKCRK